MKASPFLEEILHLVTLFLKKNGHEAAARKIEQQNSVREWVLEGNPLLEKGLHKIIKSFVRENKKIQKYYENRKPEESQEDSEQEEEVTKPKKEVSQKKSEKSSKKDGKSKLTSPAPLVESSPKMSLRSGSPQVGTTSLWMSKFQMPKKLEEINGHEKVKEVPAKVEEKKKKMKKILEKIESSEYESEEDSFELEPKKKQKKDKKVQKVEEKKKQKAKQAAKEKKEKKDRKEMEMVE